MGNEPEFKPEFKPTVHKVYITNRCELLIPGKNLEYHVALPNDLGLFTIDIAKVVPARSIIPFGMPKIIKSGYYCCDSKFHEDKRRYDTIFLFNQGAKFAEEMLAKYFMLSEIITEHIPNYSSTGGGFNLACDVQLWIPRDS